MPHDYSAQWDGETKRQLDQQSQAGKEARFPEVLENGEPLEEATRRLLERINAKPKEKAIYRTKSSELAAAARRGWKGRRSAISEESNDKED